MNNNPPAVTNHQNTDIHSGNGTTTPVPHSTLGRIIESLHPTTRVGQVFFILDHKSKLARRGVVVSESKRSLIVSYCDVFGILVETKRVRKADTTDWKWFKSIDEGNAAYDRRYPNVVPNNLVN